MQYEDYHKGGWKEDDQMSYMDMVNKYYDLATSFYEIGAEPSVVSTHLACEAAATRLQFLLYVGTHIVRIIIAMQDGASRSTSGTD